MPQLAVTMHQLAVTMSQLAVTMPQLAVAILSVSISIIYRLLKVCTISVFQMDGLKGRQMDKQIEKAVLMLFI
jgi:hypothetical protein